MPRIRTIYQTRGYKGWIYVQVLFCVFMHRKEFHVHIRAQTNTRSISSYLDRTNFSNKGPLHLPKQALFLWDTA